MKAIKEAIALLKFFKDRKNTRLTTMIKAQSCIAELEALQQRSCKGCKKQDLPPIEQLMACGHCKQLAHDNFEEKDKIEEL